MSYLTSVGDQVLLQLVLLVFEHFSEIVGKFAGDILGETVQLAQVIGQTNQLVKCSDLENEKRGSLDDSF